MKRQTAALTVFAVLVGLLCASVAQATLVAQYSFEQADPLLDDTANGYDLTNGGSPGVTFSSPTDPTFAVLGSGCGSYVGNGGCPSPNPSYLDLPATLDTTLTDFTFTMLARKTSASDNYQTVLAADMFRFQHLSNNRLGMGTKTAGGGSTTNGVFPNNEWQFVALTYRASDNQVEAYIAPASTASLGGPGMAFTASNDSLDTAAGFRIGSDGRSGIGCYDPFGGQIDQVRVYSDYKTSDQMQAIYGRYVGYSDPLVAKYTFEDSANREQDVTGHGHNATNGGDVAYVAPPSPGSLALGTTAAAHPRNSSGYLDLPSEVYLPGEDFTFTAFVRKDASETGSYQTILGTDRFRFQFFPTGADDDGAGGLRLDVNGAGASGPANGANNAFMTEQWYFVALRYDASTQQIDAFLQPGQQWTFDSAEFTRMANGTLGIGDMSQFRLGGDGLSDIGGFDAFGGWIDEAYFFNAALTDQEIANLFHGYVPEPATAMIWSLLAGLGIALRWRRRK